MGLFLPGLSSPLGHHSGFLENTLTLGFRRLPPSLPVSAFSLIAGRRFPCWASLCQSTLECGCSPGTHLRFLLISPVAWSGGPPPSPIHLVIIQALSEHHGLQVWSWPLGLQWEMVQIGLRAEVLGRIRRLDRAVWAVAVLPSNELMAFGRIQV